MVSVFPATAVALRGFAFTSHPVTSQDATTTVTVAINCCRQICRRRRHHRSLRTFLARNT